MLPSVIAMLLASSTAGIKFSVAMWAGILLAAVGEEEFAVATGSGCDSCTFLSKIWDDVVDEMRFGGDVDVNWRELGGGDGGEIDLMGDEGCDNGGEMGLLTALVDIGAGTEEAVPFWETAPSTGFRVGLAVSEAGGEMVPTSSPITLFFSRSRIPPVLPPGDDDAVDPSALVLSLFDGLIMSCTVLKMDAIANVCVCVCVCISV